MLKNYIAIIGLIAAQSASAGIFDIVEGAGETAVSPVVGLSPEHSFRYHAGEGLHKMGQGTRDVIRSPLTLGIGADEYYDEYDDYNNDEDIEAEMLQVD